MFYICLLGFNNSKKIPKKAVNVQKDNSTLLSARVYQILIYITLFTIINNFIYYC